MRNFMCLTSFTQIKEKDVKQMEFRIGIEYNCYRLEIWKGDGVLVAVLSDTYAEFHVFNVVYSN